MEAETQAMNLNDAPDVGLSGDIPENEKVKFVLHGNEVLEKKVSGTGRCGRIYLPLKWLGKRVKIIRLD